MTNLQIREENTKKVLSFLSPGAVVFAQRCLWGTSCAPGGPNPSGTWSSRVRSDAVLRSRCFCCSTFGVARSAYFVTEMLKLQNNRRILQLILFLLNTPSNSYILCRIVKRISLSRHLECILFSSLIILLNPLLKFPPQNTWRSDFRSEMLVRRIVCSRCDKSEQHLEHQNPFWLHFVLQVILRDPVHATPCFLRHHFYLTCPCIPFIQVSLYFQGLL